MAIIEGSTISPAFRKSQRGLDLLPAGRHGLLGYAIGEHN